MATIKLISILTISPAKLAGLFFVVLLLTGCQTGKSPEEVTKLFWQSLAQGQLDQGRSYATQKSQHLVDLKDIDKLSTIATGEVKEEDTEARVPTTITRNKQILAFDTVLQRENDVWKVDYLRTQLNINIVPLGDMAKILSELGGTFTKQLEQQLPEIQKSMESLGLELKKQIDEFSRALKLPSKPGNPSTGNQGI